MEPKQEDYSPSPERRYAAEFGIYLLVVPLAIAGFVLVWTKALTHGGVWWLAFGAAFIVGCYIGERLRLRTVEIIAKSRELRKRK